MLHRERVLRSVSWELTLGVLKRIEPKALRVERDQVERVVFSREAFLGPLDDALVVVSGVLRAIAQGLERLAESQGGEFVSARPEEVADVAFKYFQDALTRYKLKIAPEQIATALRVFFKQKPSVVDSILELFMVSPEPGKQGCSAFGILANCAVKITDPKGRISTGYALCNQGHILTARHVVGEYKTLDVAFRHPIGNGRNREEQGGASVVHVNRYWDIAILQLKPEERRRLQNAGLTQPPLSLEWQPRDWVLCLGYQEQEIFADPFAVEAFIKPWDPMLTVRFRDGFEQKCLVIVIPRDSPAIVPGMSGGPVMNLRTRYVMAMVTGATREAWVRQQWQGEDVWELVSSARYGFAVPLSHVVESWPGFRECCLASRQEQQGGVVR